MLDKKVSEKVVWKNSVVPDNEVASIVPQVQAEPQMMFCYKCNNVIPGNSKYCPCCQVELYTECPKCGVKYSSQYPSCNQCGTNRREYLEFLQEKQEIEKALEVKRRRQAEIAERKRLEEERKRKEKEEELEQQKKIEASKQKEIYLADNAEIMKTKEYELIHSLVVKAFEVYDKIVRIWRYIGYILMCILFLCMFLVIFVPCVYDLSVAEELLKSVFDLFGPGGIMFFVLLCILHPIIGLVFDLDMFRCFVVMQYLSNKKDYDKELIIPNLIEKISEWGGREKLSEYCIIAYRKKNKLPINREWHSLR